MAADVCGAQQCMAHPTRGAIRRGQPLRMLPVERVERGAPHEGADRSTGTPLRRAAETRTWRKHSRADVAARRSPSETGGECSNTRKGIDRSTAGCWMAHSKPQRGCRGVRAWGAAGPIASPHVAHVRGPGSPGPKSAAWEVRWPQTRANGSGGRHRQLGWNATVPSPPAAGPAPLTPCHSQPRPPPQRLLPRCKASRPPALEAHPAGEIARTGPSPRAPDPPVGRGRRC